MDIYRGILSHGPFVNEEALTVIVTGGLKAGSHITAWWKWTQNPTPDSLSNLVVYQGLIDEEVATPEEGAQRQLEHKGTYDLTFYVHGENLSLVIKDPVGDTGRFPKADLNLAYSLASNEGQSLFVGLTPKLAHFNEPYLIAVVLPKDHKTGTPAVVLWHENHTREIPAADRLVKYELEIWVVDKAHEFQDLAAGPHIHLKGGEDTFNAVFHETGDSLKFRIADVNSDLPEVEKWANLHYYQLVQ
ncbi:unnamed protein product [Clonostachys rosea]|uniref:Uncharacterized protein n=1 Tax=Bionectria ochroleuca TaxID=29856 RepID=A0ABY6UQ09_BIOOC|nr:unnamed protein product [Clonostachys rosea]